MKHSKLYCATTSLLVRSRIWTLLILCFAGSLKAQIPGNLDSSFHYGQGPNYLFDKGNGHTGSVYNFTPLADGRVYVGCDFNYMNGVPVFGAALLSESGVLDKSFNIRPTGSSSVYGYIPQPNGKMIVYGGFSTIQGVNRASIAMLNADLTVDQTWGPGSTFTSGSFTKVIVQPDGKFLVLGAFNTVNSRTQRDLLRLNADGTLDEAFNLNIGVGPNSFNSISDIHLFSDGKILVAGGFSSFNGITRNRMIILNPDGTFFGLPYAGFGPGSSVARVLVQPDGKLIVLGSFTFFSGAINRIVRLNTDGSVDNSFNVGTGLNAGIRDAILLSSGKILVGGDFTTYNGTNVPYMVRINSDGSLDNTFNVGGSGASGVVSCIKEAPNGKIYIGVTAGQFYNGVPRTTMARLNADGSLDESFLSNLGPNFIVYDIAQAAGGKYYIGGRFSHYNGVRVNSIARVNTDGSLDNTFNTGALGLSTGSIFTDVYKILVQPDGKVLVGGNFNSFNGQTIRGLIRLNSDGSRDNSFNIGDGVGASGQVWGLGLRSDQKIYVGGIFTTINGANRNRIALLNPDGSVDNSFAPAGPDNNVFTLVVQPDDKVVIGGSFQNVNSTSSNRIARFNLDGTIDPSFVVGTGLSGQVSKVYFANGKIYAAGNFFTYKSVTCQGIVGIETNGDLESRFNSFGSSLGSSASSLVVQPDGKIIISGNFVGSVNFDNAKRIIRLNEDLTVDQSFENSSVYNGLTSNADVMILDQDLKLMVGGTFKGYKGNSSPHLFRIHTGIQACNVATPTITAAGPTTFCAGGSVTLQGPVIGSGETYLWSNGATTQNIEVTASGTFSLRVIAGACTSSISNEIVVTVNSIPSTPAITANGPTTFCDGGSVILQGPSGSFSYLWSNGETTQNITVSASGSFTLQTIANACTSAVSNVINVVENPIPASPTITASGSTTLCPGGSVVLQGPTGSFSYLWSNGATSQNITVSQPGNYSLRVIALGCTSIVSNGIEVDIDNACPGNFIWNGTGSWTSAANWTPAFVPTPNSNITVQSGILTVNGNYIINNLTVNMGTNFVLAAGSVLNIAGDVLINGGSNNNGNGEVNLIGTGNQSISAAGAGAWNIGVLRVSNNSGTVTQNLQLLIWRELILENGSIFDLNGRSLTLKANATSRVTANLNMIAGNAQLLNTSGFWCEVAYPKSSIASGGSWVQTAPPVQGQQVRSLHQKGNFPSIESYNAAIPASGSFYWFSNSFTTHPTNNGFYKPTDSTEAWPLGKGIRAWIRKVPADNGPLSYKGSPFTGNSFVINNLDYCTNNCAIVDPNGLNLVGNPLAATINWDLLTKNHVEDAMYQYNHSQLIYATYIDGVGVNGGRKEIATGQGFFVHALQAGASITVPQTAVVPASTFAIFRSGTIEDLLRININLGDSSVDEMAIRLKDGATHNFDSRYDGRKMTGSGINIASIAEDGRRLSVDARPLTTGMIRIPLVMSRMNNLRNEELVFTGLESFNGKQVYLNHPSFDAPIQLTEGQRFTISPAYATGLEVIINNSPQAIEGPLSNTFSLYPNPATENLTVSGINSGTVVSVLTVQGKEIIRQTLGAEGSLSVKALPQGLYFVEINGIKKTFVKQ